MNAKQLYLFKNKDPIIDILRTVIQVEAASEGTTFSKMLRRIAKSAPSISLSMLKAWFYGATISPRHCNIIEVAIAIRANWTTRELINYKRKPRGKNVVAFHRKAA